MNPRNLLFVVASVIIMGASLTLMSQGLTDGVKVTLPHPVTIDDVVLEPGEYEIRRASNTTDQILRFFNKDELRYQTIALTIPAEQERPPEETKVILHHVGDKYYFDKIWMEGKSFGYEFPLPDRVRALQRELAATGPATDQSASRAVSAPAVAAAAVPESSPESIAPQARREPVASVPALSQEPAIQPSIDARVEPTPVEPQQNVAAVQQEQRQAPAPNVDSRQNTAPLNQANTPVDGRQSPDELPATAADWLVYVLGGGLLILAGMVFGRPVKAQG
jgi:hypothetical protein